MLSRLVLIAADVLCFSMTAQAQVSPADLKSLPNLPGYTFPERGA